MGKICTGLTRVLTGGTNHGDVIVVEILVAIAPLTA